MQFDTGLYNFPSRLSRATSGPQQLSNGVNARRARIGITGEAAGNFAFALVYDAGNSSRPDGQRHRGPRRSSITGLRGAKAFELGYSNTFFTLDRATGSNDTLFLERASPSNIATNFNTGDNRSNAGVRFVGDRYWIVGGYLTGPASGDSHTQTGERLGGKAFEQRGRYRRSRAPITHFTWASASTNCFERPIPAMGRPTCFTLSDQPELRIDPTTLLSTGVMGTSAHPVTGGYVLDFETAATFRNFFWQGEYYSYHVRPAGRGRC